MSDRGFEVDISADHAKLDDRRHLGPVKLTLSLPLELSRNTLDARVLAELEHVLSCTIDEHTPYLDAPTRADFFEDELGSGLLVLVQG